MSRPAINREQQGLTAFTACSSTRHKGIARSCLIITRYLTNRSRSIHSIQPPNLARNQSLFATCPVLNQRQTADIQRHQLLQIKRFTCFIKQAISMQLHAVPMLYVANQSACSGMLFTSQRFASACFACFDASLSLRFVSFASLAFRNFRLRFASSAFQL